MPTLLVAFLAGFAVTQLAILVTTIYLHRALSHRALTLSPVAAGACRGLLWITTGIRPRQWVAVHRKHHAFTDVEGDPHSPLLLGFGAVQVGNVVLYRRVAKNQMVVARYARDLPPDRWDRVLLDRALLGLGIGIGILCLTFGWKVGLLAAGIHAVGYLGLSSAINAVGHRFGHQPYANTARNNQWLAWLCVGEGLHNNHHALPTSARFSLAPREVDPAWWVIQALSRLRQATVRLSNEKVRERLAG
ncbi:MAG: fatty acid desaturase [Acidimicrobiales bacterium]